MNYDNDGKIIMKIGIDLDGVIAKETWLQYVGWTVNKSFGKWCMNQAGVLYRPFFSDYTIITGRTEELRKDTEDWLFKNCIVYKDLVCSNGHFGVVQGIEHKIETIEKMRIELYIESDRVGGRLISKFTGCEVIDTDEALDRGLIK
jgi:uncharacterized HAD superfamily protein